MMMTTMTMAMILTGFEAADQRTNDHTYTIKKLGKMGRQPLCARDVERPRTLLTRCERVSSSKRNNTSRGSKRQRGSQRGRHSARNIRLSVDAFEVVHIPADLIVGDRLSLRRVGAFRIVNREGGQGGWRPRR